VRCASSPRPVHRLNEPSRRFLQPPPILLRQHLSTAVGPSSRLQTRIVWDLIVFLLNSAIFLVLGVQFSALLSAVPVPDPDAPRRRIVLDPATVNRDAPLREVGTGHYAAL